MNCYHHTDITANRFCVRCGQPFCAACLDSDGYCENCYYAVQAEEDGLRRYARRRKRSFFLLIVSPIPIILWLIFGLQFAVRGSLLESVIVAFIVTSPWGIVSAFIRGDRNRSDTERLIEAIQMHDAGCLFMLLRLIFALTMGVIRWILAYFIVTGKAIGFLLTHK